MIIRCRPPAGSRLIATQDGPAVLTLAPLGAEEIEFALPWVRDAPTRRDLDVTLALADLCRSP
jgi:hypothetical protein